MSQAIRLGRLNWVLPWSICDVMTISLRGLESAIRGKVLLEISCFILMHFYLIRRIYRSRNRGRKKLDAKAMEKIPQKNS